MFEKEESEKHPCDYCLFIYLDQSEKVCHYYEDDEIWLCKEHDLDTYKNLVKAVKTKFLRE